MLGAALLAFLGIAGVMVGSGGDDPVSDVASATTIRRVPEPSTTSPATSSPATTTATPSTSTTTTSTTTTITTPGPPEKSISLSGTGDAVLDFDTPNADSYVATLTHSGEGTFIVDVLDGDGRERAGRLANEVGVYSGQAPVNFLVGDRFSAVEVAADGPWTLEMEPLLRWASRSETSAGVEPGEVYSGAGDHLFTFLPDGDRAVRFVCNDCDSDVIVDAYGSDRYGLVTHAGPYDGEVVVPADTLVIHVQAQNRSSDVGHWTLEVRSAP